MAKKLLSLFKIGPAKDQLTDPEKIFGCIKQLNQNTELMRDIYDAYSGTLKFGENKLRETEDSLSKMGVLLTSFDCSLGKWGSHLQDEAIRLREKEQRLDQLKREVEFDRKWLVDKQNEAPMKLQDHDYEKAMRVQKIRDYRAERGLVETKMKKAEEQIERVLEGIEEADVKHDTVHKTREDYIRGHKTELQDLMVDWEMSKGKRDMLQSLDVNPKTLLSSLSDKEDWRTKDKDLSELRKEHDMLRENIQDQHDRKDTMRLRNDELRRRIGQNEVVLQNLREDISPGGKDEHWGRDTVSHKHDDRHESSQRHGKGGTSQKHDGHRHGNAHKHHDHGTSHRHHNHGKSHKDHDHGSSHKHRDASPPRHGSRDGSPPRHSGNKEGTPNRHNDHKHKSRDLSPPRHYGRDGSPPRHGNRDGSPPRHGHRDGSPPRHVSRDDGRGNREASSYVHGSRGRDRSPPRHVTRDRSPPRHDTHRYGNRDRSPPRYHDKDASTAHRRGSRMMESPRNANRDISPPRNQDQHKDGTMQRHGSGADSQRNRNRDGSPPRHQDGMLGRRGSRIDASKNEDGTVQRRGSRVDSPKSWNRDGSPPRHQDGMVQRRGSRPDSSKNEDGTIQRRGSRVDSPSMVQRRGSRDQNPTTETSDGAFIHDHLLMSQFGSQSATIGHQSSDEDYAHM